MPSTPYITLKITEIRQETSDTKSFVLEEATGKPVPYRPGQFLTLIFPKKDSEDRRSYSISSTPMFQEPLTITVKRITNGEFSRHLFDTCKPGDTLLTIGASGFFTLPKAFGTKDFSDTDNIFFFAAGSGITPILPLIKTVLNTQPSVNVFLVYSNHSPESTIFLDQISALENKFPGSFYVEHFFSTSQDLMKARLGKLRLTQYLDKWKPDGKRSLFYLCGPHDYMQMISITLLTEGIPLDHIRKEIFDTIKLKIRELPPDQNPHRVLIHYEGKQHQLTVQYPTTILEAAKQSGINLPYSCEAGKCGTCSATCLQGTVWMSYNEVLLDKELAKGRVLTCVGYPAGGDVTLEFTEPE